MQLFLDVDLSPTFLNTGNTNETFKHPGKQDPFRHKLKVQTHSFLEPPLEYNQDRAFDQSRFVMSFSIILEVTEICSFRLVLEGKAVKEMPKSSRLEF